MVTPTLDRVIRTLRVAHFGLIAGILFFVGITVVLRDGVPNSAWTERAPLLLALLAAFALGCVVAHTIVERATLARVSRARMQVLNGEAGSEAEVEAYRQLAIIGAGLIDGPAFLAGLIYLLTGDTTSLIAAGVGVALLVSRMPSRARFKRFVERTREHP